MNYYTLLGLIAPLLFLGCSSKSQLPEELGKTFGSLPEVTTYYDAKGYVQSGNFVNANWPATIVAVQEGTNQISFVLKNGVRHSYDMNGYRMAVVFLEDSTGEETVVVYRSKAQLPDH